MADIHNFSHISLILAFSFLGGLFLKRLRQPVLVGYIIAGVLLGPSVLGIATSTETIEWLAELGIILLMFMIGLELDMQSFKTSLFPAIRIVILQVLVAIASMLGISFFFQMSLGFSVLIGCAIALSSTAVAINVLKELRQEHTDAGKLTTSILVAQDLAVVPMLILIQLVSGDTVTAQHISRAMISLAVVGVTLSGILYLSSHPRFLRRLQAMFAHGSDQPALAALAFVFIAAAISGFAGLSSAYGAFALGLMLRNLGELGDTYRAAIEPIHDLLLMVFFLSVGFILDIHTIVSELWVIMLILVVVIVLKTAGNTILLWGTPLSTRGKLLSAAALSQIGEFSFVLFGVGIAEGLITQAQYHIGLAVIALSLVVSPLWISLVRKMTGIQSITLFTQETTPQWKSLLTTCRTLIGK